MNEGMFALALLVLLVRTEVARRGAESSITLGECVLVRRLPAAPELEVECELERDCMGEAVDADIEFAREPFGPKGLSLLKCGE